MYLNEEQPIIVCIDVCSGWRFNIFMTLSVWSYWWGVGGQFYTQSHSFSEILASTEFGAYQKLGKKMGLQKVSFGEN